MRHHLLIVLLLTLSFVTLGAKRNATDLTGTWVCTIARAAEKGGPFDVTFVFKQTGEKLTGTFSGHGPIGKQNVTGTVKGDKAVFGWSSTPPAESQKPAFQVTFDGKIVSPTELTGSVGSPFCGAGCTWTAIKKK